MSVYILGPAQLLSVFSNLVFIIFLSASLHCLENFYTQYASKVVSQYLLLISSWFRLRSPSLKFTVALISKAKRGFTEAIGSMLLLSPPHILDVFIDIRRQNLQPVFNTTMLKPTFCFAYASHATKVSFGQFLNLVQYLQ